MAIMAIIASMLGFKAMPPVAVSGVEGVVGDAVATDEETTLAGTFAVAVGKALGADARRGVLGKPLGLHSHLAGWHPKCDHRNKRHRKYDENILHSKKRMSDNVCMLLARLISPSAQFTRVTNTGDLRTQPWRHPKV